MNTRTLIMACWTFLVISCGPLRAQDMNRVPDMNQGVDGVDASVHSDVEDKGQLNQQQQPAQEPVKPPPTYSRWGITSSGQPPATQYWPAHSVTPNSTPAQNAGNNASSLKSRSSRASGQLGRPSPSSTPKDAGSNSANFSSPSFRAGGQQSTSSSTQNDDNSSLAFSPSFRAGGPARAPTALSDSPGNPPLNSVDENNSENPTRQHSLFNGFDTNPGQNGLGNSQRLKSDSSSASPQRVIDGVVTPFSQYQSELNSTSYSMSHLFPQPTSPSKRNPGEAKQTKRHPQKALGNYHAGPVPAVHGSREKQIHPGITSKSE